MNQAEHWMLAFLALRESLRMASEIGQFLREAWEEAKQEEKKAA
jgi:hypothetical protein